MITDEQFHRELEIEKKGFWLGVKITLMALFFIGGITLAIVL